MLVDDKIKEARYFLEQMKRNKKGGSNFRYNMSACVSAARSITFVFQKEYRTRCGDSFNRWYEQQKSKIAAKEIAQLVILLRNTVIKEGNRLPIYTLRFEDPTGTKGTLEATYDISKIKNGNIEMRYYPSEEDAKRLKFNVDESKSLEEWTREIEMKIKKEVVPDLIDKMTSIRIDEIKPELLVSFESDTPPILIEEWIAQLDDYINFLSEIVSEAKELFGD